MLIILEGTDCAGKTTVIQQWREKLGAEVQKYSKPDKDPYEYFHPALNNAGKIVIADRHFVGERVYAKTKKEPSQWKEEDYEKMLLQLEAQHAIIVFVWEYKKTLEERYDLRGEIYVSKEEMWKAQNLFRSEIKRIAKTYPGILCLSYKTSSNLIRVIN